METKELEITVALEQKLGLDGKSAYQLWLDAGNNGSEADFLVSLKGKDGDPGPAGAPGQSAYKLWLQRGNSGSEEDFLASLKGKDGESGPAGHDGAPGPSGEPGERGQDGATGPAGEPGKSAYQIWLDAGNSGSEADFLASLKGAPGVPAVKSAVTITLDDTDWYPWDRRSVNIEGLTSDSTVIVSPSPEAMEVYVKAGLYAYLQIGNSLVFTRKAVLGKSITVNVVVL